MDSIQLSAITFTLCTAIVIIFQGCLAAGAPWGAASMGGKFPGKYPPKMRIVAIVNMMVLGMLAMIVLTKAEMMLPQFKAFSTVAIWFVVVFYALGSILNTITPSKIERIWAPVALIQFVAALIVAV